MANFVAAKIEHFFRGRKFLPRQESLDYLAGDTPLPITLGLPAR
jgi:hypothetical protein